MIALLLELGAAVNAKDRFGHTPLQDAVKHAHVDVARLLRENGGELGFDEASLSSELCESARSGSLDQMSLLLRNHADVDAKDYDSRTAIHLASSEGNLRIVEFLLDAGANPN